MKRNELKLVVIILFLLAWWLFWAVRKKANRNPLAEIRVLVQPDLHVVLKTLCFITDKDPR